MWLADMGSAQMLFAGTKSSSSSSYLALMLAQEAGQENRTCHHQHGTQACGSLRCDRSSTTATHAESQATFRALKKKISLFCAFATVTKVPELCPLLSRFLAPGHSIQAGLAFSCTYKSLSLHLRRAADAHLLAA